MVARSGRRRVDHRSPLVDLDVVFADDEFVDAIAASPWGAAKCHSDAGSAVRAGSLSAPGAVLTADPLAELFDTWRQELAATPIPAPPAVRKAADAVDQGRAPRRRSLRPALAIAAAIAALSLGSATIGAKDAAPDSALWGITRLLFPDRVVSVQSAGNVSIAIDQAYSALRAGRSRDAQLALLRATVDLGRVDEVDGRAEMQQTVADLWLRAAPAEPSSTAGPAEAVRVGGSPSSSPSSKPSPPASAPPASTPPSSSALDAAPAAGAAPAGAAAPEQSAASVGSGVGQVASAAVIAPPVGGGSLAPNDPAGSSIAASSASSASSSPSSASSSSSSSSSSSPLAVPETSAAVRVTDSPAVAAPTVTPPPTLPPPGVVAQPPVVEVPGGPLPSSAAPAPAPAPTSTTVSRNAVESAPRT